MCGLREGFYSILEQSFDDWLFIIANDSTDHQAPLHIQAHSPMATGCGAIVASELSRSVAFWSPSSGVGFGLAQESLFRNGLGSIPAVGPSFNKTSLLPC